MIKKVLIVAVLIGLAFFINRYTQKEMAVLKISGINLKIEIADNTHSPQLTVRGSFLNE